MGRFASIRLSLVCIALFIGAVTGLGVVAEAIGRAGAGAGPGGDDAGAPNDDASPPIIIIGRDGAPPADVSCSNPVACSTDAATYCGKIGNGCGGIVDCGDCSGGQVCVQSVCSMPIDGCAPLTCQQLGGTYCGRIGDGCGRLLDCGACTSPLSCAGGGLPNVCGADLDSGACTPTNCTPANGKYCGIVGDGCGGKMDCGGCPAGQGCGAASISNLCGVVGCTPASCTQPNGRYCGVVGDGCGGKVDCGACPGAGETCGGAGIDSVCGFPADSGACTPPSCLQANGQYCGIVGNGCGGKMDCGGCPGGQSCGGAGVDGVCAFPPDSGACTPISCAQQNGQYCGIVGNGCGGVMDCGGCPASQDCGAAGIPNICGYAADSGACTALSCMQMNGQYCGIVGNGCGGQMDCGVCQGSQTCGGAGIPNVCGGGVCTPTVCSTVNGQYCGIVGDGCGGRRDCGGCTGGRTCGGGGLTNVCGFPADSGLCPPLACTQMNGKYCGVVGDGCGGQMDCGGCVGAQSCGGDGIPNVCGTARDSGACTVTSCTQANGAKFCGVVGDGCGGQMDCGGCTGAQSCGGDGIPNVCGTPRDSGACTVTSCTQANGNYCGVVGDGCGGSIDCGACSGGQVCGSRTANVCNAPCPLCGQIPQCGAGTTSITRHRVQRRADEPRSGLQRARLHPERRATSHHRRSQLRSMHAAYGGHRDRERHHRAERDLYTPKCPRRKQHSARRPARQVAPSDLDHGQPMRQQRAAGRHGSHAPQS